MDKKSEKEPAELNRYGTLIQDIFFRYWKEGLTEFEFHRKEFKEVSTKLGIKEVDNIGDIIYNFRHRNKLPPEMIKTQPKGLEWIIEGAGKSLYRFKLVKNTRVVPTAGLVKISIPNATPEILEHYALDDEQALLAIIRYNRLIDIFLGITTFSLQNHLRTTVKGIGQIEIDELYVGIDKYGCHYVIPVQAKVGKDQIGVVQTTQDLAFSAEKFPGIRCRAIAAQFMDDGVALFELTLQDDDIRILEERHYRLVPAKQLKEAEIKSYRNL